jgi:hypothetical protein
MFRVKYLETWVQPREHTHTVKHFLKTNSKLNIRLLDSSWPKVRSHDICTFRCYYRVSTNKQSETKKASVLLLYVRRCHLPLYFSPPGRTNTQRKFIAHKIFLALDLFKEILPVNWQTNWRQSVAKNTVIFFFYTTEDYQNLKTRHHIQFY